MSGLVKGVKKVFKAIGTAVKKVMKTTIGKILVGALAIFTGGAALAAFGAMGAGASFGSVMSAGLAGGMAPFSAAFSALTGAASSVGSALGLTGGTAGATTAAVTEGVVAGGTAVEGGALAAAAAEAAAPGAAAWAAPAAETAGLFGTEAAAAGGAAGGDAMAAAAAEAGAPGAASWSAPAASNGANLAELTAAPQGTSGGWMQNVGSGGIKVADVTGGMLQTPNITGAAPSASGGNWLTNLWDFVKPETAAGRLMYGQVLSSVGNSVMQGRAQQAQQDYQARMTAVPDISKTFEKKPDFRWALAGGK